MDISEFSSLVFGQEWLSFVGSCFSNLSAFQQMDDLVTGDESPRPLRGFRRRWRSDVDVQSSQISSPEPVLEHGHEAFVDSVDPQFEFELEQSDVLAGWDHIPDDIFGAPTDEYEPESPLDESNFGHVGPNVTDPSGVEPAWQHCALSSNFKRQKLDRAKLPWEQSPFGLVFGCADKWQGTVVDNLKDFFKPAILGCSDVLHSQLVVQHDVSRASSSVEAPVVSINLRKVRKEMPDEDIRRIALGKLESILLQDPLATQLGTSIHNMLNSGCNHDFIHQSIGDCFRMKASSTLQKRAGSMWRLCKLLRSAGCLNPLRLTEEFLYSAMCSLRESGAGATTGQHMLEALNFIDSTAKFSLVDLRVVISGRCKGVAKDMFLLKNPLEQKQPLTLEHVRFLETLFHQLPNTMKCILGQLLFCIHSCCRWKDSQRIKSLWVEQGSTECLVHADALASKTSISAEARTRYLPYIALGCGVIGQDWGYEWTQSRLMEGLEFKGFALPSFSERISNWTDSPMSASEATYWLREFLGESLLPFESFRFGSHSCKSTLLTWAGRCVKIQFSPMERRLLGHHLEPSMKSILTYSREAYTNVYSKVLMMFRSMRDGTYNPDMPAVERVVQLSDPSNDEQHAPAADDLFQGGADSDSESSVASECGAAGEECYGSGFADDAVAISLFPDFPGVPESELLVHKVSKLVHALNEDGFLVCGRAPSLNFKPYSQMVSERELCEGCAQCKKAFKK